MGCGAGLRLSRRRDQRHPRRVLPRRRPAPLHPVPARGDERVPGRGLREVLRTARRLHGDLRPRRDPPAQRALRRQARPRAGRRDRRADQPHGDGRQLPAGGRPAQPVQGRRQRLRADGDGPRAAAQRRGPGDPDRGRPPRTDRDHHPQRRPGARVRPPRATRSRWCPRASPRRSGPRSPPTRPRCARRPTSSTPAARSHCWSARAPGARTPRSPRWSTCSAPASRRRCSARTCSATSCRG